MSAQPAITIADVSSFQPGREAANMLDGDPSTFWHTRFAGGDAEPPHFVVLRVSTAVAGLSYTAWTGGNGNGHVKAYAISVSDDGEAWEPILAGKLQIKTPIPQEIHFPAPSSKPFIKFEVTASQSTGNRFLAAIGDLDVLSGPPLEAKAQSKSKRTPVSYDPAPFGSGPFIVHLHCGDGRATGALMKPGLVVQGLDTDSAKIAKARQTPAYREHYGTGISFRDFDGVHLPYINDSVNNILATEPIAVSAKEIHRVLVPGGLAIIAADSAPELPAEFADITQLDDGRYRLHKKWPADIDEWTHHMHGPDNNRVAKDSRLKPPLSHLQWTVSPRYTRHHEHMSSFQAMVSASGKIFYVMDEGLIDTVLLPADWNLIARDAFNGIELWRRPLDKWFSHLFTFKSGPVSITRRLVAQADRLYIALEMGGPLYLLDSNTGKQLHIFPDSDGTEEIIIDGDRLFLVARELLARHKTFDPKPWPTAGGAPRNRATQFNWGRDQGRQRVMAFDLKSKALLWQKETPVVPLGLAARHGRVYIFDGEKARALDAATGKEHWQSPTIGAQKIYTPNYACNLVVGDNRIMVGSLSGGPYRDGNMVALDAADGRIVWQGRQSASGRHSAKDLFLIDGKAWTAATFGASMTLPGVPSTANRKSGRITGYDLQTGKVEADFYTDSDVYIMNSRCHMSCATDEYFITSRMGAEMVSVDDKKWKLHHWLRGACLYGLMPANGILYAPPNPCACYTQSSLDGFNAITGFQSGWAELVQRDSPDFVQGPAWPNRRLMKTQPEAGTWPVYRHDNKRSGSTQTAVKPGLSINWQAEGYSSLTAPVVAGGRCIFAEKERHTLHCLDVSDGSAQWSFVAGGRIDSPPAILGDTLFFGCADGWLYRLALTSGELIWKRRIAPADLALFGKGQPESVWPMSGSVLLQNEKVYCVAGRSSFLDDGMHLVIVDAESGAILTRRVMDHLDPDNREDMHQHVAMQNMPVALPDLLSSDGISVYMLSQQFDLDGKRTHIKNAAWDDDIEIGIGREHLFAATGFLDDNWFHRSYWVYGNSFLEGCSMPSGGWTEMSKISPSGKMLCFDETRVYGYGQFPEYSRWSTAQRYTMFSMNKKPKSYTPGVPDEELRQSRPDWRKYRTLRSPKVEFAINWKHGVPLRSKAIVKTRDSLFVAGPRDIVDEEAVYQNIKAEQNRALLQQQNALIRNPKTGLLLALSVQDGATQQELALPSQPVWDGMAAAYGMLYIACKDGSVLALATEEKHE